MRAERLIVRLGIPALVLASCAGASAVAAHAEASAIPTFAFRSQVVLGVQLSLLFFYAALLLLVPVARALFDGDLPIELSLRGARWKEEVSGVNDELLARQLEAEDEVAQVEIEVTERVRLLGKELTEAEEVQKEVADQILARIIALEEKFASRDSRY